MCYHAGVRRRHHYDAAFEEYLRSRRVPYVAVDEARKALVPGTEECSLKSFDFVIYGQATNLLVEIKGRLYDGKPGRAPRLESWATEEDIRSLREWECLFGSGFRAALVFLYCCPHQPPAPLFEELFEFRGLWYILRLVLVDEYARVMRPRSPRWRTVHLPAAQFERLSRTLSGSLGSPEPARLEPRPFTPSPEPSSIRA